MGVAKRVSKETTLATEITEPVEKKLLNLCELCGLTHLIRHCLAV